MSASTKFRGTLVFPKQHIYRHWPSRSALLMDACSKIGPTPVIPDTGTLKGDVTALATGLTQQLNPRAGRPFFLRLSTQQSGNRSWRSFSLSCTPVRWFRILQLLSELRSLFYQLSLGPQCRHSPAGWESRPLTLRAWPVQSGGVTTLSGGYNCTIRSVRSVIARKHPVNISGSGPPASARLITKVPDSPLRHSPDSASASVSLYCDGRKVPSLFHPAWDAASVLSLQVDHYRSRDHPWSLGPSCTGAICRTNRPQQIQRREPEGATRRRL